MTQKKKNNIIIGSLCAVVLLMAVGYAAFSSILNIKGTSSISSNWNILITNVESKNIVGAATNAEDPTWEALTATFKTNLVSPGDSIEYDITVENRGNLNALLEKITLTESNNPAIKFTSSGLEEGSELNAGDSKVLTVKVEYLASVTSQPENTEGTFTVTLDYSQKEGSGVVSQTAAEKLIATATDSGDGLYADEYETGRYVYKGANPANYITFNNEPWRIISVESDGTLKLIKKGSIGNKQWGDWGAADNNWGKPVTLNEYLNNDYYNSLDASSKELIQTHSWNVGPVVDEAIYGATDSGFANQLAHEASKVWSGNIALINPSDFIKANTNASQCGSMKLHFDNKEVCKTTNYMLPTDRAWTISPFDSNNYRAFIFSSEGTIGESEIDSQFEVHPVLYLKSDITISGNGTGTDPYTIN